MDFSAREVADQAELFAALTGIVKPNHWDMFFLVMGRTGSGKSTFIGQCTGKQVTVGHGLYSCTKSIYVADYHWNGRRIFLIDTPGFNDTARPEVEILEALASSLTASYANGVRIHGVLMLQPVSENRMSGSSLRCIEMVEAVCGFASTSWPSRCENLAIVTTMWPSSTGNEAEEQRTVLEGRHRELCTQEMFFGGLVSRGATAFRYNETGSQDPIEQMRAAQNIVAHLVRRSDMHPLDVLQLQREIVIEGKTLGQTTAGRSVAAGLDRSQQAYQRRLQQAAQDDDEMLSSLAAQTNAAHLTEIRELRQDLHDQMRKIETEKEALNKSIQELHKECQQQWKNNLLDLETMFHTQVKAKQEELVREEAKRQRRLERLTRSAASSRKESKASLLSFDDEKDQTVGNLRKEVSEVRDAHKKFTGYRANIVNGATNGIAAGITASTLTAVAAAAAGGTGALICTVM
ncbi:hypothetical protein K4K49_007108 [Colletotrichum sp. SAR 10_70]|nr:hypothetical protein K4K50_007032 [Colletotrichum sp. SAR 10_71]KAI8161108.1 hypothetical protein K4K49_007108 [Colletotrichum sp. SAR 10_70]KAI8222943.1 hypothetical protein K4K54_006474 [Colletotrichum sp. SAR 10_86]KAI8223576.1 hypothetical protein K4K53_006790 [Colletotrichum sp. SAR 10_77]